MRTISLPGLNIFLRNYDEESPSRIELILKGRGYCVWPNREGERFALNRVYPVLKERGFLDSGMTLSWPATASTPAVAVFSEEGPGILFQIEKDLLGRHREIRITSAGTERVTIEFTGIPASWTITNLSEQKKRDKILVEARALQFQAGLIDPEGGCGIPDSRGFDYLPFLADRLLEKYGPFSEPPIMHLFGYAQGHDRGYPDYAPSEKLGGADGFKRAAEELHSRGFLLSSYLNGRIIDSAVLERFPHLSSGICVNEKQKPVTETYYGRTFFVMDPNFTLWLKELEKQALNLKSLGSDIVQLDQLAGRAAVVAPGQPWGEGYKSLISSLQEKGLKVWIQGVSDYYNADWFEMTWRDVSILPGGIIRGGNPFGETDLTLLNFFRPKGRYLAPQSKLSRLEKGAYTVILDVLGDRGQLPLINEEYLYNL